MTYRERFRRNFAARWRRLVVWMAVAMVVTVATGGGLVPSGGDPVRVAIDLG